ncbi:MAG: hypothetical protein F6K37_19250 [Moorea sp. SIO4E2]|uniref:hypothetical protein n=1 Tax=Moorena sp. SIO4E2 TaxID=2607826 RepID=UPI0013B7CEB5|nr:hypothetical protein [Moorena sp. SIO4E2]NEQ08005.1 hypothetical protein [Moorena sp. SIO4E2]
MANIKVNDIKPAGAELFADSETFLYTLSDDSVDYIYGGLRSGAVTNSGSCARSCGGGCFAMGQLAVL